jgi:dipeptidyl aminopeptidase/acylaminoacyl peptidase
MSGINCAIISAEALTILNIASKCRGGSMRRFFKCPGDLAWLILLIICVRILAGEEKSQKEEPSWGKWTPELQMRFKDISGTTMSANGNYVAYVVREPLIEGEKPEYLSHIWVGATDGSFNVQYTRGEKSTTKPSFSPDSQYLAFTSSRESEKDQIWIMRVFGGEAEKISDAKGEIVSYKWSPDGSSIAYIMKDPETDQEEKAKKEKRDVILVDQNFKYNHLYTVSISELEQGEHKTKRLTSDKFHITSFDWSPDGKNLVIAHQPIPLVNMQFVEQDISTVPADSGKVTPLVTRPGVDSNPLCSPDGKWVAFVSRGGSLQPIGLRDAYIVPVSGGEPLKLAETHDRNVRLISWMANSKNLLYSEFKGTSLNVFSLPIDGEATKMITTGSGNFNYTAFNKYTDLMAFTYESTDTPMEIYYSPVSKFKMNRLSAINTEVPKPEMGKTDPSHGTPRMESRLKVFLPIRLITRKATNTR